MRLSTPHRLDIIRIVNPVSKFDEFPLYLNEPQTEYDMSDHIHL